MLGVKAEAGAAGSEVEQPKLRQLNRDRADVVERHSRQFSWRFKQVS